MLKAELDTELGYSLNSQAAKTTDNRRNGSYLKTATSSMGEIKLVCQFLSVLYTATAALYIWANLSRRSTGDRISVSSLLCQSAVSEYRISRKVYYR